MFASKLFLFWLLASSIQLSHQFKSIYVLRKYVDTIMDITHRLALDLTACLRDIKERKFLLCLATIIVQPDCDFYLFQKDTTLRRRSAKRNSRISSKKILPNLRVEDLKFDHNKKLVIIVHEASENHTTSRLAMMKQPLIYHHGANVLTMDWRTKREYSTFPLQGGLVLIADVVGRKLRDVLEKFIKAGVRSANMHVIGHGVGAQIAAFAAKYLNVNHGKIGRLTGINPFGENFNSQPTDFRIDKTDAKFVDCIFTNSPEVAMRDPVCGANFYPSCYGKKQPGDFGIMMADRAALLFAESVIPRHKFHAKKCAKIPCRETSPRHCKKGSALMGYPASPQLNGIYYVKTEMQYPFSPSVAKKKSQKPLSVYEWIKRFMPQSKYDRRRNIMEAVENKINAEVGLLQDLIAYLLQSGVTLSKCSANAILGYERAITCLLKNFLIKDCNFILYKKESPDKRHLLRVHKLKRQAEQLNINKRRNVVLVIHGVTSDYSVPWAQNAKYEILANHNANVILMDWRSKADHLLMASNVGLVPLARCFGNEVAYFINSMTEAGWDLSQFHLVGHSLGAQIAAFAGKELKKSTSRTLPRISALDPTGLIFDSQKSHSRLDEGDAEFVDCIFTSSPVIGMSNPVCTANFYANCYGQEQPGTDSHTRVGGATAASHLRAALLFAESAIPSHIFYAMKCDKLPCYKMAPGDCHALDPAALMGYPYSTQLRGIFYVMTRGTYPYAMKH